MLHLQIGIIARQYPPSLNYPLDFQPFSAAYCVEQIPSDQ